MHSSVRPLKGASGPLLAIRNVSKDYGFGPSTFRALENVSLDLRTNEFCTLLGPSGCGKTTLLRIIAGFAAPTSGELVLDGEDLISAPPNKRPVNTVFQSYALFPHLTVEKNIAFGLERLRLGTAEIRSRVQQMLELVQLTKMAARLPRELSGGQQQRVALARALAPKPRLLLLDEPLSALDLKLRRGMQIELKKLQRETGITFVLVTHDQEEALFMSDRIAVIGAGRLLQVGTPQEVYERPRNRFVADFIGEANILPGALFGVGAEYVAVRPERIALSAAATGGLPGTVAEANYLGCLTSYSILLSSGDYIKVCTPAPHERFGPGQQVFCTVPQSAVQQLEG